MLESSNIRIKSLSLAALKSAYKPSGKPGALEALEWRQFERWQKKKKARFARSGPFSHIPTINYFYLLNALFPKSAKICTRKES